MKRLFLFLFLFSPAILFAQTELRDAQKLLIGSKIKGLAFTDYLQNIPDDTNFDNKFKVLEFWATWCKPCLAAVPHLNKLQEKFNGNDSLVFLSVTDESAEKTEATLEKVNFKTIVVSDRERSIHKRLNIQYKGTMALPRTVLIDNENRIVWYGTPKELTPKLLQKFLAKEKLR